MTSAYAYDMPMPIHSIHIAIRSALNTIMKGDTMACKTKGGKGKGGK